MQPANICNARFGRLTAIRVVKVAGKRRSWLCECDCGAKVILETGRLTGGNTRSCGCLRSDLMREARTRHGHTAAGKASPEYWVWAGMIQRCSNPNHDRFPRYGARGIKVCDRWKDFANFIADMGPRPSPRHSIDRIDLDGDYTPDNCRWATAVEQQSNTSRSRVISFNGESRTVAGWARSLGVSPTTLSERLEKWPLDEALTTPRLHTTRRPRANPVGC